MVSPESLAVARDCRRAPIDRQAPRSESRAPPSVSRASPRERLAARSETLAVPRARHRMSCAPLRRPRDSTITASCAREAPGASLAAASDLVGTRSDSQVSICDPQVSICDPQVSICDMLAAAIVSLGTYQEVARCTSRRAANSDRRARCSEEYARYGERVARSSERLARCTDRLPWYAEPLFQCNEQVAAIVPARRLL
jgi:hypothetical protein